MTLAPVSGGTWWGTAHSGSWSATSTRVCPRVPSSSEAARTLSDTLNDLTAYLAGGDSASGRVKNLEDLDLALTLEDGATLAPYLAKLWGRGEFLDLEHPYDSNQSKAADVLGAARTYLEGRPRVIGVTVPGPLAEEVRTKIQAGEGQR